ncbi:MAG: FRG domain-containing protein, partial [Candidatus Thiodiazotropha endolucinida]
LQRFVVSSISTRSKQFEYYRKCWDLIRVSLNYKGYVWRGHGSSSWDLTSTLERELLKKPKKEWSAITHNHLTKFKYAIRGRRGSNPAPLTDENDWWALGQHHGLSTPLLDWSSSPFVALYFAFSELNPHPKGPRAVYALHKYSADQAGIGLISPLTDENQRLVNQAGLFTRSPDDKTIPESLVEAYDGKGGVSLLKIIIPNRERDKCMKTLERMNINHLTLFPDIYGASVHCNHALKINEY